ncbi:DUF2141 domain-containing protein [uncultured Polaribacter sp.]|uniref:DUF2141 domain-containing protein n=1 Tax=uncultured Polaribacter sp. TaxID=174711 RepID=UPI00261CDF70|nr:DUF2141 domain-containing protein [uncultured Polaribacter sp.]
MKLLVSILVTVVIFISSTLTAQEKTSIKVTVVNATSDKGKVSFALYNKAGFLRKPIDAKRAEIVNGKSTVTFNNVVAGEYSVVCSHDKNGNGKMDFHENGMPMEDYGSSNNVMSYGPPNFYDSKFTISDKNVSLDIKF